MTLEIDDSALDQAQAKIDKLIESLEYAEGLMGEIGVFANPPVIDKEKPPEGGERNETDG